MTSIATPTSSPTKVLSDPTNPNVYPSPSLSPVSALRTNAADNYRRLSVRELMTSTNPPASPLDALVMALEATAEGMTEHHIIARSNSTSSSIFNSAIQRGQREGVGATADEEDPNATVPSSPSFFIKHAKIPSLHQLPSLELPAAVSTVPSHLSLPATSSSEQAIPPMQSTSIFSNDFTSSTHPVSPTCPVPNQNVIDWRKLSVSSQGSVDSTSSTNTRAGRHKMFVCSVNSCEKKFYQVAHLRIHERCHTGTRPFLFSGQFFTAGDFQVLSLSTQGLLFLYFLFLLLFLFYFFFFTLICMCIVAVFVCR
ncbi:hypothetical protein BCR41DRAFT_219381 [Lobosporangium transversale]|uniref:C2H2-type domain-containing protein n=1 Tax=Lobosporangium transversale TaxID=64571 RepID=A0A1Y2GVG0_9FUNG|nr:hypothetical protein BCR41DRAFT_219381 [Lobosporangium transversale]ORZ26267.1 hypothetical protein BCR41DRAFT_219381 [Lobosporangium transversale]|eukprot:XP_021884032.1 hypothetical protein BCR41DRAFT_219381 [Lobosporangium transversale]